MTWAYNETTHEGLDADGGSIAALTVQQIGAANGAFEGDEGYLGKYWNTPAEPAIENTCVEGGATAEYAVQLDLGATSTIDVTQVLAQVWFLNTAKTGDVAQDADGVRMRFADSAEANVLTNFVEYKFTGAVTGGISPPATDDPNGVKTFYADPLVGGWNQFIAGGANRITAEGGTGCDLTDVRHIALVIRHQATNTGGQQPSFALDWYKSGNTFTCTGTENLDNLRTFDRGVPGDRGNNPDYGLEQGSGIFYEIWGAIEVGNGTLATTLTVEDSFVNINMFAEEIPYDVIVRNNATLNSGRLDDQIQDDYPVGGTVWASVDEVYIANFRFDNGSAGNLYGSRIFRWNDLLFGEAAAGTDPTLDIRACDIDTVRNVEFRSTNLDILDTDIHDPLPTFLDAAAAFQDDAGTFTAVTTNWNNAGTTTAIFPGAEAVGDGHVFGFAERFGAVEFEISTVGVGGVVVWEYWDGTAWQLLTNVDDGTDSFTVAASDTSPGVNGSFNRFRVTWDIPTDWDTRTINTVTAFYVRARITSTYSTNPQIRQGRIGQRRVGTLFDAPNSISGVRFFKCDRALRFAASVTVPNYIATDNAYDAVIDDLLTVTLVDSTFDPDKLLQI